MLLTLQTSLHGFKIPDSITVFGSLFKIYYNTQKIYNQVWSPPRTFGLEMVRVYSRRNR